MRKSGAGKLAAALVLGLATSATAQEAENRPAAPARGLLRGWFGGGAKAGEKRPVEEPEDAAPRPSPVVQAAREQEREMNAFLRRQAVCDRLTQVAQETGDEELQRQADELMSRAWELYQRRTAHLPLNRDALAADETRLRERLGTGTASPLSSRRARDGRARQDASRAARLGEEER